MGIHKNAKVEKPKFVRENVVIRRDSIIGKNVFIDDNTIIGRFSTCLSTNTLLFLKSPDFIKINKNTVPVHELLFTARLKQKRHYLTMFSINKENYDSR